jgi:hypothetical protein
MIWVAWRQFRTQAIVTFGLLAAFAALVIVTGLHVRDAYTPSAIAGCTTGGGSCPALDGFERPLSDIFQLALVALPALLGMFWGAPLVARELESGTFRLAWTQSVTRRRWLLVKVAVVGVAVLAVAGLASWLVSWWLSPVDAVALNRFQPAAFMARGIVAIGYAGFAFALGVAVGALMRRTLPAMAATLFGFVAARIVLTFWVRPHLLSATQALTPVTAGKGVAFTVIGSELSITPGSPPIPNAWMLSSALVDRAGHVVGPAQLHDLLVRTCPAVVAGLPPNFGGSGPKGGGPSGGAFVACQQRLSHHLQQLVSYQPPSHFWPLQALETGIFLAAALALIGATAWAIGRRGASRPAVARTHDNSPEPVALSVVPQTGVPPVPQSAAAEERTEPDRDRTSASRRPRI